MSSDQVRLEKRALEVQGFLPTPPSGFTLRTAVDETCVDVVVWVECPGHMRKVRVHEADRREDVLERVAQTIAHLQADRDG